MSRARELSRLGNPNIISADSNFNVGFGTATPKEKVNVVGVVSATQFFGDGSTLEGIASAGIGTALSDDKTKALNTIYFTNDEVLVTNNSVVNPPDSGHIAYTQAPTIVVDNTKELTVSDGDDLLVDVLGISTGTNVDYAARGNGVFGNIYVDNIESSGGQTSVNFPKGLVSTGVATFHSDVSIGGTLTYEDVKNIDSVGLITARTGIKVSAGGIEVSGGGIDVVGDIGLGAGKQTGTPGQVLTSGGSGANASWSTINAAPSVSGISSGAISAGSAVMMNSDGKLSAVTGTAGIRKTTCPFVVDNATQSNVESFGLVYDTLNNQYIFVYQASGNVVWARTGQVSGSDITWSSATQITSNAGGPNALWDTVNNRLLILYPKTNASSNGYFRVCSVSGTTITVGSEVQVTSTGINRSCMVQDPVEDKIVVFWENTSNVGKAIVGEITAGSNTSSWAGETTFCSNRAMRNRAVFYPGQNKVVCSFMHYSSSEQGGIVAGTVSGNSVSFGTIQYYETSYMRDGSIDYDTINGQLLINWSQGTGAYNNKVRTATLSGTTFTFGVSKTLKGVSGTSGNDPHSHICFDPNSGKALTIWVDSTAGTGQLSSAILTMSGSAPTNITQADAVQITNNNENATFGSFTTGKNLVLDSDNYVMTLVFRDSATGQVGARYFVERIGSSNMNANNFVGFSQAAYTNGQTVTVDVVGSTNTNQTGLTTATKYFVKNDGSLGTAADDPSVEAGLALSFTSLLIR